MRPRGEKMDEVEKYLIQAFDFMGDIAASLDSTGWAILATCTLVAGYALLRGPGIRGA